MLAAVGGERSQDKGPAEVLNELWELVKAYAIQETVDPLKSIGRFLGWGLLGSLTLGLGLFFGGFTILRILQTETDGHLSGSLDWVPYFVALLFTALAAVLSFRAIKRPYRGQEKQA